MRFRRKANKALAFLLALSLVMSTNMPVNVLANEAAAPETEPAAAIEFVKSGDEVAGIDLNANPVIIQEATDVSGNTIEGKIQLILDADRDGIVDEGEQKLAIDGVMEFDAGLDIYGTYSETTDQNIFITQNSGVVGTICGSYYAAVTSAGDSITIRVNGGSATEIYGLNGYDYYVSGRIVILIGENATVGSCTVENCEGYPSYFYDNQGVLEVYGNYTMQADEQYKTLNIAGGTFVVPSGMILTAEEISLSATYGTPYMLLRGNLNVTDLTPAGSGRILVDGGTLPENFSYVYTYYPFDLKSDISNSAFAPSSTSYYADYTENGVTTRFLKANQNIGFKNAAVQGYDCYYSVDGGEYTAVTGTSFSATTPQSGSMQMELLYVPTQISVMNTYSAPKGYVGTTYTADEPLCDLSIYPIANDTTAEYGNEVKYAVKKATPLPEGLSLVKGKIIGTPTEACEEGQKVTVVVTGRNGSTANLNLTIKISDNGEKKTINELVSVDTENKVIDLNGTSVIVMQYPDTSGTTYSRIYRDADHDGLPDDNVTLLIDGSDKIKTDGYSLIGYRDTTTPYNGDISIRIQSGAFDMVCGVAGVLGDSPEEDKKAVVDGDVSIYAGSLVMSPNDCLMGASVAEVNGNVTVSIDGGNYKDTYIVAAESSTVTGDVDFSFTGMATVPYYATTTAMTSVYVTDTSKVGGDVNINIGAESTSYGFIKNINNYDNEFGGVYSSDVAGDVNCTVDGYWQPATDVLLESSTVGGNVDIDWMSGTVRQESVAVHTTIEGNLTIDVQEDTSFAGSATICDTESAAKNLHANIPSSCTGIVTLTGLTGATEGVFCNNKGTVTIDGNYQITEDLTAAGVTVKSGADVTIAEGVVVDITGYLRELEADATLTNRGTLSIAQSGQTTTGITGTLINEGEMLTSSSSSGYKLMIGATGKVINRETGTWTLGGRIYNNGAIYNYGSFVQTWQNTTYNQELGTIYTTMPLTLYSNPTSSNYTQYSSSAYKSSLYYAVNVDYPVQCAAAPTLTAGTNASDSKANLVTSGLEGDDHRYIRVFGNNNGTVSFSLTPGEIASDKFVLSSVTYGSAGAQAQSSTTDGVTVYTGTTDNLFEPITITLNYSATEDVEEITINPTSDTIANTDEEQKLVVGKTYTDEEPLYDLTKLTISNDIAAENGKVLYTVKSGSLPEGFVLKDGKVYGSFTKATDAESMITFTVKGLNQTTADFTLTLGAVAKAVPQWDIPAGFETTIGKQVGDVRLPVDVRGTYAWESSTEAVGDNVGAITTNLIFTPADKENYDWEAAAEGAGINAMWNEADGTISCTVSITVLPGEPEVTAPTGLTAVYGQTFADVALPTDENGKFEWDEDYNASEEVVGDVGEQECYVTYIPTSENYKEKTGIKVTLTVAPATPEYKETLAETSVICDGTLGDILLPDVDGGKYQWVSATSVEPVDGASYQVIYLPEDTTNYDWTAVEGWNKIRKGIVFSIRVNLEHAWGEGVVTTPATQTQTGVKTYTCGLCDATRTETIDKLPQTGGGSGTGTGGTGTGGTGIGGEMPGNLQPQVGYTMSDSGSKAVYKVSSLNFEVTYVKPNKKTYTKVKIPNTIKYEGVTYKVTAIANNAFKNNKKLKNVTIGSNIKTIGNNAFYNCSALKSITIPKNVSKIGSKAFYNCKKLTKMTIKTSKLTQKNVGKNAFKNMGKSNFKKTTVKVPKKKLKTYKKMLVKRGLSKKAKVKK